MRFDISNLARPADTDVSDLTSAKRTGPPAWTEDGGLEIPFDRYPVAGRGRGCHGPADLRDHDRGDVPHVGGAYLALSNPSPGDNTAQLQRVTRLLLSMLDPA
jgi:hypothetical protein